MRPERPLLGTVLCRVPPWRRSRGVLGPWDVRMAPLVRPPGSPPFPGYLGGGRVWVSPGKIRCLGAVLQGLASLRFGGSG